MNPGPIHLRIDELVLEGFNPADRHRIADALQRELVRLLQAQPPTGISGQTRHVERLPGGSFVASDGAGITGRQIAQSLSETVRAAVRVPATAATGRPS